MAKAQANAGLNPANFLMAAADLKSSGALSMPQDTTAVDPSSKAFEVRRKNPRHAMRVIK